LLYLAENSTLLIALQNTNFVTSQLCVVMTIKLKMNLSIHFLFIQDLPLCGDILLFMINALNFIYTFLISPTYFPIAYQGMASFPKKCKCRSIWYISIILYYIIIIIVLNRSLYFKTQLKTIFLSRVVNANRDFSFAPGSSLKPNLI